MHNVILHNEDKAMNMSRIFNPFIIGKYAGAELFCDRKTEADLLCHNIITAPAEH